MKKRLFAILCASLTLASCVEDTVTSSDYGYSVLVNPTIQTRATETSFENGDQIGLSIIMESTASAYKSNYAMTYTDNLFASDLVWYSDNTQASTLLAYYPYISGASVPTSFTINSDQTVDGAYTASDLMMSKLENVIPSTSSINMTFTHSLSRIVLEVDNQSNQEIESITISGSYTTATVDLDSQSVAVDKNSEPVDIIAPVWSDGKYKVIIVPQEAELLFTVKLENGTEVTQTASSMSFVAGSQHAATLTYTEEDLSVSFSNDISDWNNGGSYIIPSSGVGDGSSMNLADPFVVSYPDENDEIKYNESLSFSRTIYVDPTDGDDSNDGLSQDTAIKTLTQLNENGIQRGDEILLKGGVTHYGTIEILNLGVDQSSEYIRVGSYGGSKARINAAGEMAGVRLENSSNVYVSDLKITANGGDKSKCTNYNDNSNYEGYDVGVNMRCGVNITNYDSSSYTYNVTLYNIDIRDIYYYGVGETPEEYSHRPCKEWSTGNEGEYGWGIKTFVRAGFLINLNITDCNVRNVSHTGIKMTGDGGYGDPSTDLGTWSKRYQELVIDGCTSKEAGGPGMMFTNLKDAIVRNCEIVRPGSRTSSVTTAENSSRVDEPRKWGRGSGMWLVRCDGLLFEKNLLERSEGTADCCGAHIDIGNRDIIVQYCLSKDNAGGFIEILGNNYNCSYRYNVSINDGWRNQDCPIQAELWDTTEMTDGYLVTINGHNSGASLGPFNTYIYNNTIVATPNFEGGYTNALMYEYEMSAQGILMTNNIFWVPQRMELYGWSANPSSVGVYTNVHEFRTYDGTSARDMTADEIAALNYSIKNNLYRLFDPNNFTYDVYGYPDSNTMPVVTRGENDYWDESPLGGDPGFKNYSESNFDLTAYDLIPTNADVINRGVTIEQLDLDTTDYGLDYGLNLTEDYFGNPITTPIVGAIAVQ
ncbi:MAG: fimbrillin family protein [Rikenellaceae bacterium]